MRVVRLGLCCTKIGSGSTPRGGASVYRNSGIPFIRSQNVYSNRFEFAGLAFIDDEQAALLSHVEVRPGDVLLNITGDSVARAACVPSNVPPARVSQHVAIVRPDPEKLVPAYLQYVLTSPQMQRRMRALAAGGGTRPALTKAMIRDLCVPLPPRHEQRAIAGLLGALDDKIELNRQMAGTLEEIARTLFQSWFVDFEPVRAKAEGRPTGLRPEVDALFPDRFVDSPAGPMPAGWRVLPVGGLAQIRGGATPPTRVADFWASGRHCWATPRDLARLATPVLLSTERCVTDAGLARISSGLLPAGVVLLSSRAPIGYLAIAQMPVAINQGFIAMLQSDDAPGLFLLRWAQSSLDRIVARANGSTFLEISKAAFRPMPVTLPPRGPLNAYLRVAGPMFDRVVLAERESNTLAELRDLLLPGLISGEIRIRDAERSVESVV